MKREAWEDWETVKESDWLKKAIGTTIVPKNRLKVILKSVGNPDFKQWSPLSEPKTTFCSSLKECVKATQDYIHMHDLGGGNWPETRIWYVWFDEKQDKVKKKTIATISANGRVWNTEGDWKTHKEILLGT